jgi:hypothetical protein
VKTFAFLLLCFFAALKTVIKLKSNGEQCEDFFFSIAPIPMIAKEKWQIRFVFSLFYLIQA